MTKRAEQAYGTGDNECIWKGAGHSLSVWVGLEVSSQLAHSSADPS